LDVEDKHSVCRYTPRNSLMPIGKMRANANAPVTADTHALDAISQAGDELAIGESKGVPHV
jgi:hypothetical protein